jgi:3-hydroxyisobutyrate dehydrogenase
MGGVVKLANQLLVGIQHVAMAESFLFGIKLGADPKVLFDVITRSSGDSFILRQRVPYPGLSPTSPANNDFTPGFTTELMAKDMDLILSTAKEVNVPLPTSSLAYQLFEAAKASGFSQKDCSIVSLVLRRLAGESV